MFLCGNATIGQPFNSIEYDQSISLHLIALTQCSVDYDIVYIAGVPTRRRYRYSSLCFVNNQVVYHIVNTQTSYFPLRSASDVLFISFVDHEGTDITFLHWNYGNARYVFTSIDVYVIIPYTW